MSDGNTSSNTGKTIEITVSPTGEATVQTKGFSGPSCRDASKFVERALGEKTAETLTSEFYQPANLSQKVEQG